MYYIIDEVFIKF